MTETDQQSNTTEQQYWDSIAEQRERDYKLHITLEAIRKILVSNKHPHRSGLSYVQKLKAISILVGMVDVLETAIEP